MKIELPAGEYYIGDPCYAFPNEGPAEAHWEKLCDALELESPLAFKQDGIEVYCGSTAYGDGSYVCHELQGTEFSVDSGLLGIMPMSTVKLLNPEGIDLTNEGAVLTFKAPFNVYIDSEGFFLFGAFTINTAAAYDEEGEEDCNDYDDYDDD